MRVGVLSAPGDPLLGYVLQALERARVPIHAVIMDSMRFSEKHLRLHEQRTAGRLPPIPLSRLHRLGVPFHSVDDHRSDETTALVGELSLDLLVNAGTPRILKSRILTAPRVGIVNCHPGLLPEFRGCTCVEWAILRDERIGNTVHFMDDGIDTGPIVLREGLAFRKGDSYVDIRVKVYEHGHELIARGVRRIIDEALLPEDLPPQGKGRYFSVIHEEGMREVLEKTAAGRYAFQE